MASGNTTYTREKRRREEKMSEKLMMYPERPSEYSESFQVAIESLSKPPEIHLNQEQREQISSFEKSLFDARVPAELKDRDITEPGVALEVIAKDTILNRKLCLDYFSTDDGRRTFAKVTGKYLVGDINKIRATLARDVGKLPTKQYRLIQKASNNYAYESLTLAAQNDEDYDPIFFSIVNKPDKLLERVRSARELKAFYKSIDFELQNTEAQDPVKLAELSIVTMYKERLNTLIASSYRHAIAFYGEVLADTSNSEKMNLYNELCIYLPGLPKIEDAQNPAVKKLSAARLVNKIDKFINGIESHSNYIPVSQALETAATQDGASVPAAENYSYKDVGPEIISHTMVNADQLKKLFELTLQNYGLLDDSNNTYEDGDKNDSQPKVGWTVEIQSNITNLSVTANKRIIRIPSNFSRSLSQLSPAGALPVLDHEMTHVIQHENSKRLGLELTSKNRGARGSLWFEAGAVASEVVSQEVLFGQERTTNYFYLAALKEKLKGGSASKCVRAFYDGYHQKYPEIPEDKAWRNATERTLRLLREGGEWTVGTEYWSNSAPLEYAEQKILADSIPDDKRWLLYIGKVNLQLLASLHKIDWIKKEDFFIPEQMPSTIVEAYVRQEILPQHENTHIQNN